eukprot:1154601-Pelagomonas_calceolata.AAC.1
MTGELEIFAWLLKLSSKCLKPACQEGKKYQEKKPTLFLTTPLTSTKGSILYSLLISYKAGKHA